MEKHERESQQIVERPLRFTRPDLYGGLVSELEKFHIHPYDVAASVVEADHGLEVTLRFGEDFKHAACCFFTNETLQPPYEEIKTFFRQSTESCQRALVADYYKMMKP